jgi:iron complex transport system ATP-binding protein
LTEKRGDAVSTEKKNSAASAAVINTSGLDTGYDKKVVVSGAEIEIRRGEIVTLIGPNGAGKSTVLKTIAGQLEPLGGTIYIYEKERGTYTQNDIARMQSVMLTERMSSEKMTCEEVVSLGRYPYTGRLGILSAEDKRIVRETMDLIHISEIKDRDYHEISDGQRQRVLLARAICQEPEIMILDEPTSYLDIRHKLEFLDLLRSLVEERQIGVIMSMHELELAHMTADKVICISSEGKIEMTGKPEEVFRDDLISRLYGMEEGRLTELYSGFLSSIKAE